MASVPNYYITPEEYLERERAAEYRSEYFNGQIFAMAGATEAHILITANLTYELTSRLREGPCMVLPTEMRILVDASGLYTYPDIAIVCGERRYLDGRKDTLRNPTILIEILSPSTERYDRGAKFEHYRKIESLREYVMVSQDRMRVERFTHPDHDGQWLREEWTLPEESLQLASIDCTVPLSGIYHKVELEPAS